MKRLPAKTFFLTLFVILFQNIFIYTPDVRAENNLETGVAALNTERNSYSVGEEILLDMAVLDETGNMACDAKLTLIVKDENGETVFNASTNDDTIKVLPDCSEKIFKLTPDFEAAFKPTKPCRCTAELFAETTKTTLTAKNYFEVTDVNDPPAFNIQRQTTTRLYPVNEYPVKIFVIPNEDFKGTITETAPSKAKIKTKTEFLVDRKTGERKIFWEVDWKKGQTYTLEYSYGLPEESPEYYEFGGLTFTATGASDIIFTENRKWQIAVDPRVKYDGAASQFEANATSYLALTEIDTDKFVVCYTDTAAAGQCRVATVSGFTVTWGTENQFDADVVVATTISWLGACKLATDKFAVAYTNATSASAGNGATIAGSVSGTTITYGSAVSFDANDSEYTGCAGITTDRYIIGYNDETNSDTGAGVVCTTSGTTVTCGTPVDYNATDYYATYNTAAKLDTNKFVVTFRSVDNTDGMAVVGTESATVITWGTPVQINGTDDVSNPHACSPQDVDRFVIVYNDETNTQGEAIAGTVATRTITLGTAIDFNPSSQDIGSPSCTFISANEFVVAYPDSGGDSSFGNSNVCKVDWSTRAITCAPQQRYVAEDILDVIADDGHAIATLSNYGTGAPKIVVGFIATTGTDDGNVEIGDVGPLLGAVMVN